MGVNTWDLMDKARYTYNRAEVSARLDAMVKAGWGVGRTWGFSLGDGLTNGIMGTTVADKNKILETGPGAHSLRRASMKLLTEGGLPFSLRS